MKKEKGLKKNIKKQIVIFIILLIIILSLILTILGKAIYSDIYINNAKIEYSKEYLEWENLSEEEKKNTIEPRKEYISLDTLYNEIDITSNKEQKEQSYLYKSSGIPASYNLNDSIGNIKVETQLPYNTCYAYAALNSVETNLALATGNIYDFSEMHVEYMTSTLLGGNRELESGGNFKTVIGYLGKEYGPVLESDIPTKTYTEDEYSILTNAVQIAKAKTAIDFATIDKKNKAYTESELTEFRNRVKTHIMEDGSVFAGFYMGETSNYYDAETYAYCCLDGQMQMNHAVSIVGWNDNFSKDNFPEENRPSSDGAYIALNSWGEEWGNNGYFYISYEDVWIEYNMSGIVETEELGPEIQFSGYSNSSNKISVDVNVTDKGKSGIDESSLKYVWKNSGEIPSESEFINSFVNGERISIDTSEELKLWVLAKNNKGVTTIEKEEITIVAGPWDISATEGDNVIANFYSDGTLAISGIGNMLDWKSMDDVPWVNNRKEIQKVVIEEGIVNVGKNAFHSNYLDYAIKEVKMSDTIQKIGQSSFGSCRQLVEIDIPGSVQTIGLHAFSLCNNLQIVKLGEGVQRIEEMAFAFCENLTTINLPEGLKYIGLDALRDNRIEEIIIPSTVETIEPRALTGAKAIIVNEGNEYYSSIEGHLFNKEGTTLVEYASGNTSTEYMIPDTVTRIGKYSFYKCENLITIRMNDNVKSVEIAAFEDCTKLENLQLSKQIQSIPYYMLEYCASIKNIEIPDGVTGIGYKAFSNCTSLEEVTIGRNVKSIGESTFEKCDSLKKINVAEGNLSYTSDNGILFNGDMTSLILSPAGNQLEEYTIPESVITIENSAFYNNGNLKTITLSNNLATIGDYAFENCGNLTNINNLNNVETIGMYAFSKCYLLTSVENMKNLKSIGVSAFSGCSSIETMELPEGITKLEGSTFYKCTSLKDIKLPNTITSIGNYEFSYTAIENIDLPDNLLELGCAFSQCTNLMEIVIPNTLIEINSFTFENCSSLTNIELPNTIKEIGSSAFDGCSSMKNIKIPEGVETIGCYAFGDCTTLESIDIPDTVKEIEYDAFYNCKSLKDVKLSKNINVLGKNIFYQCSLLQNVNIPEGIEEISYGMFAYCSNLKTIEIPSTIKKIGEAAFYECTGLTEVAIPEGVEVLDKGAFYHCTNLEKIVIPNTVITINEYNFTGCNNLTIYCLKGSAAETYAINNNINYVLMEDECTSHEEVLDKSVEATCTETGLTEGKHCAVCNEVLVKQEEIAALGHSFTNYVSNNDATCTEDGTKTAKCNRCEVTDTKMDEESKIPHNYEGGICTECGKEEPKLKIISEQYNIQDSYITKIQEKTTIEQLKANLQTNATEIKVYNKNGQEQEDTKTLATGMRIEFKFQNEIKTHTIVVTGDATGDGEIKFSDMLAINMHLLNKRKIEGAYFKAADAKENGKIEFNDFLKINMFMLSKIVQL